MNSTQTVTRFAPSPTGRLHLGHAFSAVFAWRAARDVGGRFLLRIEDIDPGRCKEAFVAGIAEDLSWLGIDWDGEVWKQSERMGAYSAALERLQAGGFLYPCFCTRKDIEREIEAAGGAPHGPAGVIYPGTCRGLPEAESGQRIADGEAHAWRLDIAKGMAECGELGWEDAGKGEQRAMPERLGDVVLARKEMATSYHLAVSVDDAEQGVTLVTRGEDLWESTHIHRLLQALLDLPVPRWHHHRLMVGQDGRRFAKRDGSVTLESLRQGGMGAEQVLAQIADGSP